MTWVNKATYVVSRSYAVTVTADGRLDRRGIAGKPMEIVAAEDADNGAHLVVKIPGERTNHSGIRGMRDDRYHPMKMATLLVSIPVVGIVPGATFQARTLIQWCPSKRES